MSVRNIGNMTPQAFEYIAQKLRPRLLTVGRQFFGEDDTAEDIAQETLMRLWLIRERIDMQAGVEPLALRMAKNLCVSEWRKRKIRQAVVPLYESAAEDTISQQQEEYSEIERLRTAVSQLTPVEQRLFRMRHEAEMDIPQIAAATGIGTRSISAMLSAARRKLKIMLNQKGGRQ